MNDLKLIPADSVPSMRVKKGFYEKKIQEFLEMPCSAAYVAPNDTVSLDAVYVGFRRALAIMNVNVKVSRYKAMDRVYLVKKIIT